jgi:hypothetical protein
MSFEDILYHNLWRKSTGKKLGGQSKTLKAAVIEYKRRYRRPPPKGIDAWWNFAQKYEVKMTDEHDGMIIDDLKPSGPSLVKKSADARYKWAISRLSTWCGYEVVLQQLRL